MLQKRVVVEEIRCVSGSVEILGFGSIRQPYGEAQEVEVQALVASNMDNSTFDPARDVQSVWIGSGQLDLLAAGSRWRGGEQYSWAPASIEEGEFTILGQEPLGTGAHPAGGRNRPFPSSQISSTLGFLLKRLGDGGSEGAPDLVLLPHMEFLRSVFGVSSSFLVEMFDAIRNGAVSRDRGLIDLAASHLRKEEKAVVVVAGRALSREEAILASALVVDDALRKMYFSVFQQLSANAGGGRDGRVNIALRWPWKGPIPLKFEGRWITRAMGGGRTKPRFIATRLLAIGIPLRFQRIEVRHPGSDGNRRDDLPPPAGRQRSTNAATIVLTTGRASSGSRTQVELASEPISVPTADAIEIEQIGTGPAGPPGPEVIGEDRRDEAQAGTGGRIPGADPDVAPAGVRRKRAGCLDAVRDRVAGLTITWVALEAACKTNRWSLLAMPKARPPQNGLANDGFDFPAEPLIACVSKGLARAFVADWGSAAGDERSLGILIPKRQDVSDRELGASARGACEAIEGRWRSTKAKADDFEVRPMNRAAELWTDPKKYAEKLGGKLGSFLRP